MVKSVGTIVSDVQTCIDEIAKNDSEWLLGQDASEMDGIIKSKIYDAVRFVYLNADIGLLDLTWNKVQEATVQTDNRNKAVMAIDDDVLRICYIHLAGWVRPIDEVILSSSKEYATLSNPITTGYPDNPKAALSMGDTPIAKRVLELYGVADASKKTVKLGYMPEPQEVDGAYDIPEKVYRGVVYYAAGLTLLTYKDTHADALMNQSMMMIGAKMN